jgi:prevent-host-death family protein
MANVTIRDLRNHGGDVIDRVAGGEHITVTRSGKAVAELRPLRPQALSAVALLRRWHQLPDMDDQALRRDIDAVIDAEV